MAQRGHLSHILFRLLPGYKPLEVAQYPDRMRLGLLPGCVDPGDMPKADPVEGRGFFGRARGKRFVLALQKSESGWVD